ncbi:MAG TPA: hydroxymethylbilane synthase, partial [Methanoregulaceae archaeon]|nr:hydroxymethylbilane synthase [Methanoregulaceae archaeon]
MPVRIGTRGSRLALAQAERVASLLRDCGTASEIVIITTKGDTVDGVPLHEIGGQGVFVRALDDAIIDGTIDAAVHSMKDIPAKRPDGLRTCAILKRDSPADFLVHTIPREEIRVIGTTSTRRRAQLLRYMEGILVKQLRGNVDTRLRKLTEGQYDAIVLAEAGLERMGLSVSGTRLSPQRFVPSPNQGTIAVV